MAKRRRFALEKRSILCFSVVGDKVMYREPKVNTMREIRRIQAFKDPVQRGLEKQLKEFRAQRA